MTMSEEDYLSTFSDKTIQLFRQTLLECLKDEEFTQGVDYVFINFDW